MKKLIVLLPLLYFSLFLSFLKANKLHNAITINLSGNGPRGCAAGDLNNDGYDDIVIACMKDKKILILYSNGTVGSFSTFTINTPLSNLNVDVGDIDGNGLKDISFTEKGPGINNHTGIYYQTSLNKFTNTIYLLYGDRPVKIADANNDGKLDLCSCDQQYKAQISPDIFSNRAYANSDWSSSFSGNTPGYYFDITDINNDGKNDILTFGSASPRVVMTFPGTSISEKIINTPSGYDFITADVNNDGLKDIITSYFAGGSGYYKLVKIKVYYQTASLSFGASKELDILNDFTPGFDMSLNSQNRILLVAKDFNGDNLTDIAFVLTQKYKYNYLYVIYQNKDNTLENPTIYQIPSSTEPSFFGITAGDFNGDKRYDIAITDYYNNKVYIFYQNSALSHIDFIYPAYNEAINTLTPEIKFKGYDNDNDTLKYKIELYKDDSLLHIYNQTETTQGWSKSEYSSGEEVTFQIPQNDKLEEGNLYSLKIYAYDGIEWSDYKELKFSTGLINNNEGKKNFILTPNNDGNNEAVDFNLNNNAELKIYNVKGELIYSGKGEIKWNGTDMNGKLVPSGVYFYQIKDGNKYLSGTISVIR